VLVRRFYYHNIQTHITSPRLQIQLQSTTTTTTTTNQTSINKHASHAPLPPPHRRRAPHNARNTHNRPSQPQDPSPRRRTQDPRYHCAKGTSNHYHYYNHQDDPHDTRTRCCCACASPQAPCYYGRQGLGCVDEVEGKLDEEAWA